MRTRLLLTLVACALAPACRRAERADAPGSADTLLFSSDRVAVHDAGVDAYRRKRHTDARRLWRRAADLGDRELGTLREAYAHAVAAQRLARGPQELGGASVARDPSPGDTLRMWALGRRGRIP